MILPEFDFWSSAHTGQWGTDVCLKLRFTSQVGLKRQGCSGRCFRDYDSGERSCRVDFTFIQFQTLNNSRTDKTQNPFCEIKSDTLKKLLFSGKEGLLIDGSESCLFFWLSVVNINVVNLSLTLSLESVKHYGGQSFRSNRCWSTLS